MAADLLQAVKVNAGAPGTGDKARWRSPPTKVAN